MLCLLLHIANHIVPGNTSMGTRSLYLGNVNIVLGCHTARQRRWRSLPIACRLCRLQLTRRCFLPIACCLCGLRWLLRCFWCITRLGCCTTTSIRAFTDNPQYLTDSDGISFLLDDLLQYAALIRRDFHVYFIGLQLHKRHALAHTIALVF